MKGDLKGVWFRRLAMGGAALLVSLPLFGGEKTDHVVLSNGDLLTGEIKSVERGKLRLSTDDIGTIEIEWDKVRDIASPSSFDIELEDGTEYLGSLDVSPEPGRVRIVTQEGPQDVDPLAIVRVAPIKANFWERLDGSLSLGASYTKSSDTGQFTLGADARSRTPSHLIRFYLSSIVTTEPDSGSTERLDVQAAYQHFLEDRWLAGGGAQLQRNEELGIKLRTLVSGGAGRHINQTLHSLFTLAGGLAVNSELQTDSDSSATSLEAVLGAEYSLFHYDAPETEVMVAWNLYPGITEWGRVRSEFNARLRRELFNDFFFEISVFDSYDSDPPAEDAVSNDWGFVTSIGWTF